MPLGMTLNLMLHPPITAESKQGTTSGSLGNLRPCIHSVSKRRWAVF